MEDLKETHKGQHQRPENSATKELKCDMEEVADFRGEPGGKADNAFLQAGKAKIKPFDGERLTEKEKQWLTRIAKVRTGEKSGKPEGQEAVTRWTDFLGNCRIRVFKTSSCQVGPK